MEMTNKNLIVHQESEDKIRDVARFAERVDDEKVLSLGFTPSKIELLDFEKHVVFNYAIRFNEVSTKYEVARSYQKDEVDYIEWVDLNVDELISDLIRIKVKRDGKLTDGEVTRMLRDRRVVPSYDPFKGYLAGVSNYLDKDDDFDYIDDFAKYLKAEGGEREQARWQSNFKKALVRTVKCAIDDKYFNKHCIVLYSQNQSVGKTSYLRTLCPPALKKYYYEGAIGNDKDSQTVMAKNFIIMIDELANLTRTDINVLKATLSRLSINIRLPYAANFEEMPRRASFWGTTNRNDFLTDSENVRWIVITVDDIDRGYGDIFKGTYNIDINKIWAQAYRLLLSGFNCELSSDDLAVNEENNSAFSSTSLEKEVIMTYFRPASSSDKGKKGYHRGQSSEIFEMACKMLEGEGKEFTLKSLRQHIFFSELTKIAGWRKVSYREGGKVFNGYHFIVGNESDDDQKDLPF